MSFYSPMQAGPDWGGGIQDLMSQFMIFQMLSKMYPGDEKGKEEKDKGMPDFSNILMGQSPLPQQREMPQLPIGQSPMGQMGQSQVGQQQPGIDMQQIMQMLQALGGIPGLTK